MGEYLGATILVLYVSKEGGVDIRLFDSNGMLVREQCAASIKHIKVEAEKCSADISFAEFEAGILVRVSGRASYEQKNSVLEVRCVGD